MGKPPRPPDWRRLNDNFAIIQNETDRIQRRWRRISNAMLWISGFGAGMAVGALLRQMLS